MFSTSSTKENSLKIFIETKEIAEKEKHYTRKLLKNLMVIERDKLYCNLKHPSLYKYIIKELGYSDAEATVRVNAVRLMLKSRVAAEKVAKGKITLSNAAAANKVLQNNCVNREKINLVVEKAQECSARKFNDFVNREFKRERKEVVVLQEYMIKKFDRLRKKYGDLSTLELINIMLERELKAPAVHVAKRRVRPGKNSSGRYISASVKRQVYTGKCANCDVKHGLEYDHIEKYSHGGSNKAQNLQMLCRSCNQRKEIVAQQTGFFT